jgi:hypothetical protein
MWKWSVLCSAPWKSKGTVSLGSRDGRACQNLLFENDSHGLEGFEVTHCFKMETMERDVSCQQNHLLTIKDEF